MSHMFGPFMVANRKFGKMVEPYFSIGYKTFPVADADLDVELGDKERMVATRILVGGALLGPAGMLLGTLATEHVTVGRMTLTVGGQHIQTYEFPGHKVDKAIAFVEALAQAQGVPAKPIVAAAAPPTPPPPPPTPAAWSVDPGGTHELRWWDGARWTEHVSDGGRQTVDPLR